MSSYVCPECGMGFPEKRGKVHKRIDGYDDLSRVEKALVCLMVVGGASTTRTEIHCPDCEYVLIGDSDEA